MAIRMSGLISNMDTDSIVKELMSAQSTKKTKIENKITLNEWTTDKWKDLNTKIYSLYTGSLFKMKTLGSYTTKSISSSNDSKLTATGTSSATNGTNTVEVKQLASAQHITGNKITLEDGSSDTLTAKTKLSELGFTGSDQTIKIATADAEIEFTPDEDSTIQDFVNACKEAGINANFDEKQQRIFLNSTASGKDSAFSITSSEDGDASDTPLQMLGLTSIEYNSDEDIYSYDNTTGVSLIEAEDSLIIYNGAELTGSTNSISVNEMTLDLKGVTAEGESINLTVSNNVDDAYKMVKDFLTEYNTVLDELNTLYSAPSTRGYEPLTDEQKEAMTDDEVEKWETKIKDSLLRRDSTLSGIITEMKSITGTSVTVGDKQYSLGSFGIDSAIYTEKGKLHINGDSDDTLTANEQDKLKKALEEDPDTVAKVLSEISSKLYSGLQDKMKTSSLSSALTFYNDKELTKYNKQYKSDLSDMETKLQDMEDRYYKQFTAMETALAKINSQSSSLASLTGSGS